MKVLLLGAGGMLGRDLAETVPGGVTLRALPRAELDITDARAVERTLASERPDVIVNAAAYTAVDRAETEPARAFAVNAAAVGVLGRAAAALGAAVVHFSTDYVFDGELGRPYREDDEPRPLNVYGRSKLAGEVALRESGVAHLIVRTQWLFGRQGRSFPRVMWERALRGERTRVVNDQFGRPTAAWDLAAAVWRLIARGARGTVHVAGASVASWYEVAKWLFAAAGRLDLLSPCASSNYTSAVRRPLNAVLDTTRFEQLMEMALPDWRESLDVLLKLESMSGVVDATDQ